jgi:hypothetical protein
MQLPLLVCKVNFSVWKSCTIANSSKLLQTVLYVPLLYKEVMPRDSYVT